MNFEARIVRIEDELAIGQLRARYCHFLDDMDWPAFIALFTPDGVFEGLSKVQGREALMRFFSLEVPKIAERFWHFCTNGTVAIDGDRAVGRISMEYISTTQGQSYVSAGHYDDVMVKVDGEWKFVSRKITFYFYSPLSEGFTGSPPLTVSNPAIY
ncbi:nuclear transport factor 2 family protein [Acidovorax sp. D2M1]|uniref:Nuclear transport factor 2 family protein n=1 Tax=Acidovorax benzenivorans TaxID=2987520 RepID=A0ABT5RZZ7_9BURK|nr:nuclear transport factor 2 family protein [Acidovorax benzenivorans]MDD2179281.1 nuclear transport factor 2 family protein [Acidovorax benzenivorans]